jgi:hypothetical protein
VRRATTKCPITIGSTVGSIDHPSQEGSKVARKRPRPAYLLQICELYRTPPHFPARSPTYQQGRVLAAGAILCGSGGRVSSICCLKTLPSQEGSMWWPGGGLAVRILFRYDSCIDIPTASRQGSATDQLGPVVAAGAIHCAGSGGRVSSGSDNGSSVSSGSSGSTTEHLKSPPPRGWWSSRPPIAFFFRPATGRRIAFNNV